MSAPPPDAASLLAAVQEMQSSIDALRAERDQFQAQALAAMQAVHELAAATSEKVEGIAMQQSRDRIELRNEHNRIMAALAQLESSSSLKESRRSLEDAVFDSAVLSPRQSKPSARSHLRRLFDLRGHAHAVVGVAFSRDGTLVGTASADKTARVWNAITGALVQTLIGHADYVRAITFNPDASMVATGSSDNKVFVWTTQDGNRVASIALTVDACAVNFSPTGDHLVVGSGETVSVWDAKAYKRTALMPGLTSRNVYAAVFSPDGASIAAATDTTATVWDLATGQEQVRFKGHSSIVVDVNFSPKGTHLATASWDKSARVWSLASRECQAVLSGHTSWVNAVSWSCDGSVLCTASSDCTVAVWEPAGRRLIVVSLAKPCTAAAFSPTDDVLVVGCKDSNVVQYRWS